MIPLTYDHELTLIRQTIPKDSNGNPLTDGIGNPIINEVKTVILCGLKSVSRNEFYNAAAAGLKPEIVFVVHGYEYNGERIVEFEDNRYRVIRTYMTDFEEVELVCEKVISDG